MNKPLRVQAYDSTDTATSYGLVPHHLLLAIPRGSEEECRQFYVGILGLHELQKPSALAERGGLWVRGDQLEIHLGVEEEFRPARKAHPGILVGDLDAMAQRFAEHDVTVQWDGDFPGYRRFYVFDNVGNRLEFLGADRR
jgi:catechol 2,3-dioxygenase-like lactoylglutathione lyase family enzyme